MCADDYKTWLPVLVPGVLLIVIMGLILHLIFVKGKRPDCAADDKSVKTG